MQNRLQRHIKRVDDDVRRWTHILTTNNMAAQPPQASPVSQAHATYTHGQDAGDLAARARG